MAEFTFLESAVSAALYEARKLGCCRQVQQDNGGGLLPITSMQMNEILMAAWHTQEAGDFNVTDLRTNKKQLTAEILRLRKEAEQMQREWDKSHWAKLELEELEEVQRHIKVILKATRRLHKKRIRFVEAWELLEQWANRSL